ncbi:MAG: phosphoenolpyruvate-utilizing N-terminal domain-containing protein, partial [Candidatus Wallbacteria bacterium]|nr:phosphoenolpyruvate-utilizing N-terminal domain-containing protein [Candidatus Wallbacteria bacterium]
MLKGIVASEGLGIGRAYIIRKIPLDQIKPRSISDDEISAEIARLENAIQQVRSELSLLKDRAGSEVSSEAAEIIQAQMLILSDPLFLGEVMDIIRVEKLDVSNSYIRVRNKFIGLFEKMKEDYFRERADDIREVGEKVIEVLQGYRKSVSYKEDEEIVLIGKMIGVTDLMHFDKSRISGICVESFGRTSHMAIFAKTLEIPMIVGLSGIAEKLADDRLVILDGLKGRVLFNFSKKTLENYRKLREEYY